MQCGEFFRKTQSKLVHFLDLDNCLAPFGIGAVAFKFNGPKSKARLSFTADDLDFPAHSENSDHDPSVETK